MRAVEEGASTHKRHKKSRFEHHPVPLAVAKDLVLSPEKVEARRERLLKRKSRGQETVAVRGEERGQNEHDDETLDMTVNGPVRPGIDTATRPPPQTPAATTSWPPAPERATGGTTAQLPGAKKRGWAPTEKLSSAVMNTASSSEQAKADLAAELATKEELLGNERLRADREIELRREEHRLAEQTKAEATSELDGLRASHQTVFADLQARVQQLRQDAAGLETQLTMADLAARLVMNDEIQNERVKLYLVGEATKRARYLRKRR